jgi:hypothetical protein
MWDIYRGNWIFIPMAPVDRGPTSLRHGGMANPRHQCIDLCQDRLGIDPDNEGTIGPETASPTNTVIKMRMGFQGEIVRRGPAQV